MTFDDFVEVVSRFVKPKGVEERPPRPGHEHEEASWLVGNVHAWLFYSPQHNTQKPIMLSYAFRVGDGVANATIPQGTHKRLHLTQHDAESAAQDILLWTNVRFEATAKHSAFGGVQDTIFRAIQQALPGSSVTLLGMPQGIAGISVVWQGFQGLRQEERKKLVRESFANLLPYAAAPALIQVVLVHTPDEYTSASAT